jgi:hypothetical protein
MLSFIFLHNQYAFKLKKHLVAQTVETTAKTATCESERSLLEMHMLWDETINLQSL